MDAASAVNKALDGKKKAKTHTHGVHYERADNGGMVAHVHKHFGKGPRSEGHSHTEEHVISDKEAAAEHLEQHMGDQPGAGEMEAPAEAEQEQASGAPSPDMQQIAGE